MSEIPAKGITYEVQNPDQLDPGIVWRAVDQARGDYSSLEEWLVNTAGGFSVNNFGGIDTWGINGIGNGSPFNADVQQRADFFNRNTYRAPRGVFDEMRLAYNLMTNDDVVSGICDLTEGLAIQRVKWECEDIDEEDIWDQIAEDLQLNARIKEMWRELYGMSQFYVAMFWGKKTYKVRGKTEKEVKRRKKYDLSVPLSLSLLDPTRVVPVGNLMFGKERLAWLATEPEIDGWSAGDAVLHQLWEARYTCTPEEENIFSSMGLDTKNIWLLNNKNVWRHTLTRPSYKRWADVRMKSVFPLADLKANLRQSERAHLVGATNFIIVVRKGTDKLPARQQELDNLEKNVRKLARVPLLVGDHRLSVDIITPNQDYVLQDQKWDTLDSRIGARLLGTMAIAGDSSKRDDQLTLGRAIARGLESRRSGISLSLMNNIVRRVCELNSSVLDDIPNFAFSPKHIALDWDPAFVQLLMAMRDRGDLSRETFLEEANFSQAVEARRREYEAERYDDIFQTAVPFDSPQNNSQAGAGGAMNTPKPVAAPAKKTAAKTTSATPAKKTAAKKTSPSAKVTIHVKGDVGESTEGEVNEGTAD